MGLETIAFYAAGAGAMAALAPTVATIRPGNGDAFIVAVCPMGVTLERVTLTCPQDPRWDAAGCAFTCVGDGGVQDAFTFNYCTLPKKIPVKRGVAITATQAGAGDGHVLVYVDYPDIGEPYMPRSLVAPQDAAFLTNRLATAGGALTAHVISVNSTSITNFYEGRHYTPVEVDCVTGGTGPEIALGWTDPKTNLMVFFPIPITEVLGSGVTRSIVPFGACKPLTRGETLQIHFLSTGADTPAGNVIFAHD